MAQMKQSHKHSFEALISQAGVCIMMSKHVPASPKTLLNIPTAQGQLETFHPIGFMGYRLDKASGCYLLGNGYRMYNPVMRAFYSPDSQSPFGVGGISRYQYCYFDPINRSDPSGHVSRRAIEGTILGILGIIVGIAIAIPTGGASLSLTAVGIGAVATIAGAAAIGTGIASFVYSAQGNDEKADLLGNISLGLGGVSFGMASIGAAAAPASSWLSLIGGDKILAGFGGAAQVLGGGTLFAGAATGNETAVILGEIFIGAGVLASTIPIAPAFIGKGSPRVASFMAKIRKPSYHHPRVMRDQMANAARSSKAPTFNEYTGTIWSELPTLNFGR